MDKLTVVIPNYNGIKYIDDCLNSVCCQETGAWTWELLVVDNGSEDGSLELVESKYPQVRVIRLRQNTGFCHAVNVGIRSCDTPFVVLLNNDTIVEEGFLRGLAEAIERRPNVFAVSAQLLMWDKPELLDDAGDQYCVLGWAFARGKGKNASLYSEPEEVFAACGGAAIYRKSVFEEIGYFDENHFAYLEDIDICYRARLYGYRSWYEPSAKVLHFGSASSGSRYNAFKTKLASANSIYLIGKNMPLLQILWNLPFLVSGFLIKTIFFFSRKMGMLYLKGLLRGLKMCFSAEGRTHKIPFRWSRMQDYLLIQGQLYLNTLRFLRKR